MHNRKQLEIIFCSLTVYSAFICLLLHSFVAPRILFTGVFSVILWHLTIVMNL